LPSVPSCSIDLLTKSGIDFVAHEARGIDPFRFGELLMSSGVVLNEDVTWVTFHRWLRGGWLRG
jgi:CCR4-NOT transcription complex subunit 7/8